LFGGFVVVVGGLAEGAIVEVQQLNLRNNSLSRLLELDPITKTPTKM